MAKILVVDDNEKNMMLVRDILVFHKYEVIEARNGEEGIKKAKDEKPDLILMDIQMPVTDGFTAAKVIKHDPEMRGIKIIGITSYAMKGDRERVLESGFDDYISKPIDTRALPELLKKHLAERRP
jgi:two-component system cell cycle response regulator DivK